MKLFIKKTFKFLLFFFTYSEGFAQTTGPSQPEVQSFQQASIDNLVELSTGEFQYNIPLFQIGNYPVNLIYNSQVGMEQEASMVGLGFNINCGAITRQVRGLPDDFKKDAIGKKASMKENITQGIDLGVSIEFLGKSKKDTTMKGGIDIGSSAGLFWNNYTGFGIESNVKLGFHGNIGGLSGNAGIGVNSNSNHGTSITPYAGMGYEWTKNLNENINKIKATDKKYNSKGQRIKANVHASSGMGFSFNSISYTPKIDLPFTTKTFDFNLKYGYAAAYIHKGVSVNAYRTIQKLESNEEIHPGFGFLYAEEGKGDPFAVMDFNRDNEGVMTEEKPFLPYAYATPDVYSVAGQGIGGIFELKRNNVFIAFDAKTKTNSKNLGGEFEVGGGVGAHLGGEVRYGYTKNTSVKWDNRSNKLLDKIDFNSVTFGAPNSNTAEQVYFKNPNDVMFNDNPIYSLSKKKAISPIVYAGAAFGGASSKDSISIGKRNLYIDGNDFVNKNRDNRLESIYYLTASEARDYGIQKYIENYPINNFIDTPSQEPRVTVNKKDHHLSEMTCLKPDGTRYIFNIPAYNNIKKEFTYSVEEASITPGKTSTSVVPNEADFTNHIGGKDNFISITETPAYAHSFLLGSVLAPGYIDVDDNGPSVNDIGDYTKFNYSKVYDDFYWKSNNSLSSAPADKGMLADKLDAKASFVEGHKEVWILHSIETKNEVSRFFYSQRNDVFDLKNGQKLYKLDSIQVFSRPELTQTKPVPTKRIYFDYNAPVGLCKGIMGSTTLNKLTLNGVYFKGGSSNKGKHSRYNFAYSATNPTYDTDNVDRWGNYKPSPVASELYNKEFPFVSQDARTLADQNASAWLLNKISLPSGGEIAIDYEAHDYAYVQNKKAMFMAKIVDVVKDSISSVTSSIPGLKSLYSSPPNDNHNYLIFKLQKPIIATRSEADNIVKELYFKDAFDNIYGDIINSQSKYANLYAKVRVELNTDYGLEDVEMFLDATDCGVAGSGSGTYNYGFVKIKESNIGTGGGNANQISKFAWQLVKHAYAGLLFNLPNDPSIAGAATGEAIFNALNPVGNIIKTVMNTGPNVALKSRNVASTLMSNLSYIRLYEPTGYKVGGNGARVKKITISDNWQNMAGSPATSASYATVYNYTKDRDGVKISSGVASYEPETGGAENPWKQPVFYKEKNGMMADDNKFMMTPYGESLFPSANVIYSEVKVIKNPVSRSDMAGTGYSKNTYYTAYDFPSEIENTMAYTQRKPKLSFSLLKNISNDFMLSSQGFAVITNDMHGKPKSEEVFGDKGDLISGKYYKYRTDVDNKLINIVRSVDKSGRIEENKELGIEAQLYGDARRFHTETFSGSAHANFDLANNAPTPPIPPVLTFWPDVSFEKKEFTSFVLLKHIRQQGILESVKVVDKGSTIVTSNELWDQKTGAVLLTRSINEFKDTIFNFTYPAHWAYSGMGMASDNIGASHAGVSVSSWAGIIGLEMKSILHSGDIVLVTKYGSSAYHKYIVDKPATLSFSPMYNGASFSTLSPGNYFAKVINSGKRNIPTTPIGSFTSLKNPIVGSTLVINNSTKVVNTEAVMYNNVSTKLCNNCDLSGVHPSTIKKLNYNPNLAPWQIQATYKFVDDRSQSMPEPNIRKDGYLTNFTPFWITGTWTKNTSDPKWQFTEFVSMMSNKLKPIESVNPLFIFSNTQPSNFEGLQNASTSNARYFETLFDSFEDSRDTCNQQHYSVVDNNSSLLDNTSSHTGYYSMKVGSVPYTKNFYGTTGNLGSDYGSIIIEKQPECMPNLTLYPDKKYIFSAWVKENGAPNIALNYNTAQVALKINGASVVSVACKTSGLIIDGWQRIETEFTTPAAPRTISLTFSPNCNFDDVRIFPSDANMKSYVYSYKDYSLMSILDENNFASFFEYDEQKQLRRVKKETDNGVVTLQEINFGSAKK
jgi:hypothetical protein